MEIFLGSSVQAVIQIVSNWMQVNLSPLELKILKTVVDFMINKVISFKF